MKHRLLLLVCAAPLLVGLVGPVGPLWAQDAYYRALSQSMEEYGTVLQEIATKYVDDVPPQLVVRAGIRGMLGYLDPYSVYLVDDERESVDRLSSGSYVGLGFTVAPSNGSVIVSDVRPGYPAFRAGLRRGDRLVAVDGVEVAGQSPDSVRTRTRGPEGTLCRLSVVRAIPADTLTLLANRERIPVVTVSIAERLPGSIGYVRLDQFSRRAAAAVAQAIDSLQATEPLAGLVLDLRDNPGGLLEGAIQICELFLPMGSPVVTTRGQNVSSTEWTTTSPPLFPDLPLVILINGQSASSAEIVAGALQDLDRAVIIGQQSFGKGLVQTVRSLGNGATLKLTTSRYYTPSGRCIQRKGVRSDVDPLRTYTTRNGRSVSSGDGVQPDRIIVDSVASEIRSGIMHDLVRSWAVTDYVTTAGTNPITTSGFIAFVDTLPTENLPGGKALAMATSDLQNDTVASGYLQRAAQAWRNSVIDGLRNRQEIVQAVLTAELASRTKGLSEYDRLLLPFDATVRAAQEVLSSVQYRAVLRGESDSDQ